jgi:hypothetical protein
VNLRDRGLSPPPRPETIRGWLKIGLEDRLQHQLQRCLHHPVRHRRNPQPTNLPASFRDRLLPDPVRDEPARLHLIAKISEHRRGPGRSDRPRCDLIHPGGAGAGIGPHTIPRRSEESRVIDQVEHIIETAARIGHCPSVQLGLHPKYPSPRLGGVDGPRDTGIHQCVSFPVQPCCDPAGPLPQVAGFPGLAVLRALRPIPARSTGHASTRTGAPMVAAVVRERRNGSHVHPRTLRRDRHPAMPLHHRHGYAAGLHRGLPDQRLHPAVEFPNQPPGWLGARCDPTHVRQVSGRWFSLEERSAAGFSRMPV